MDALIPIREVADHFDLPLSTCTTGSAAG